MESDNSREKRRYVQLTDDQWSEAESIWTAGDATLQELSDRYGITVRGLQARFNQRGFVKGGAGEPFVLDLNELPEPAREIDLDDVSAAARDLRQRTVANAERIERLMAATLASIEADPSKAQRAASVIKALSLAAGVVERLHAVRHEALGLEHHVAAGVELPVILLRDVTQSEIEAVQRDEEVNLDDLVLEDAEL